MRRTSLALLPFLLSVLTFECTSAYQYLIRRVRPVGLSKASLWAKSKSDFQPTSSEELLSPLRRSTFELQEEFWITPENLAMEVLISTAERPQVKNANRRKFWSWLQEEVLNLIGYRGNLQGRRLEDLALLQTKSPILLIHGSFHSAWCFAENFMPFFNSLGHDCYAISLRGTAATGMPPMQPGESVKIEEHVADVSFCIGEIMRRYQEQSGEYYGTIKARRNRDIFGQKIGLESSINVKTISSDNLDQTAAMKARPIIVAHSFGGMIVQKLLESQEMRNKIAGIALCSSVPPSGNTPMALRRSPWDTLRLLYGFVLKGATSSMQTCRDLFFDRSVPENDLTLYMKRFQADSRVGLDLSALNAVLPVKTSMNPSTRRATWLPPLHGDDSEAAAMSSLNKQQTKTKKVSTFALPAKATATSSEDVNISKDIRVTRRWGAPAIITTTPMDRTPTTTAKTTISSTFIGDVDRIPARLVLGGAKDFLVDQHALQETARYLGIDSGAVVLDDLYHDIMLGPRWTQAAEVLAEWLEDIEGDRQCTSFTPTSPS